MKHSPEINVNACVLCACVLCACVLLCVRAFVRACFCACVSGRLNNILQVEQMCLNNMSAACQYIKFAVSLFLQAGHRLPYA